MNRFEGLSMKVALCLILGVAPTLAVGTFAYQQSRDTLMGRVDVVLERLVSRFQT